MVISLRPFFAIASTLAAYSANQKHPTTLPNTPLSSTFAMENTTPNITNAVRAALNDVGLTKYWVTYWHAVHICAFLLILC